MSRKHEAKDIRLYKCVDFPLKWKFAKTLIKNVSAVDTNIFYKDKKWWLLTTLSNSSLLDHNSQLHVFSSENILSDDWKPHKKNPVIFDPCLLYTSPSPRDGLLSRMPSSA